MVNIWRAAGAGDVGEVERLVGQDPGLLNAGDRLSWTPLMWASREGHVGVVRCLAGKGAAVNERAEFGRTALWLACFHGSLAMVRLLVENGADPTGADNGGSTPLMIASEKGHLEVVRFLLGLPSAKGTLNRRSRPGRTALWWACYNGRGAVTRLLLERGADPTVADNDGTTPTAIAKRRFPLPAGVAYENRRECVAALGVRSPLPLSSCPDTRSSDKLAEMWGLCAWCVWQEAERAYLLWKARQVADAAASFAARPVVEPRTRGEGKRRRVEAVPEELRGRAAAGGGEGLPGVTVVAAREGEEARTRAALLEHAVQSLKPGVFEELVEMMG
jgi:hypothetical protein